MNDILFGNNNSKVITKLSKRYFKKNKVRNLAALLAIILTAFLFTSITSLAFNMASSIQLSLQMQKGSKADGTLGYMTEEQYEQLVNSDFVEQAGHRRIIGYASNTSSHSIEINYADSVQQELTFCVPTHGAAPEKANEIATTDLALKALGVEPKVGAEVPLEFELRGKTYVFVMLGLYAGLRREEILALQWDSVYLDTDTPYLTVRRAWHTESNRPVILDELKTKAAERNIPLPICLADCLKEAKANSTSEYVVPNRDGDPLSYTQFKRLWQYIVTRTVKERVYYRYEDGKRVQHTVTPVLGEKAAHNGKVVYSLDFEVTPHQLRHTYITNLIHSSVDPKTVQYLAGHESSKITMDIYAKVKYNRPDELVKSMGGAFAQWDGVRS